MLIPWRASPWAWRNRGVWSAYLAVSTCATSRSVGRPTSISCAGAQAWMTEPSQARQAYLGPAGDQHLVLGGYDVLPLGHVLADPVHRAGANTGTRCSSARSPPPPGEGALAARDGLSRRRRVRCAFSSRSSASSRASISSRALSRSSRPSWSWFGSNRSELLPKAKAAQLGDDVFPACVLRGQAVHLGFKPLAFSCKPRRLLALRHHHGAQGLYGRSGARPRPNPWAEQTTGSAA